MIFDKSKIDPAQISTAIHTSFELEGMVCTRSGGNIYMLSLMSR